MVFRYSEEIKGRFISPDGLDNLSEYEYSGEDHSIIYNYLVSPFAKWLCKFTPLYVSANMLTLGGLLCTVAAYTLMAWYAPTLTEAEPSWVYFVSAALIFVYLMLDAMDGTQARNTDMASPIGELFDHLCDSFSLTLTMLCFCIAARCGPALSFAALVAGFVPFFSGHWNDYNTGKLIMGRFGGPTDVLVMLIIALTATGSFGTSFWLHEFNVFHYQFRLNEAFVAFIVVSAVFTFLHYAYDIHSKNESNPSQRKDWAGICFQLFAFVSFVATAICWRASFSHSLYAHPHLFMVPLGFINAYLNGRLIVQRVTQESVTHFHLSLVVLLASFLTSKFGRHHSRPIDDWVLWGLLAFSACQYVFYFTSITRQLSKELQIPILTVPEEKQIQQKLSGAFAGKSEKTPLMAPPAPQGQPLM